MNWFHRAADQGNTSAQHDLGRRYFNGIGTQVNLFKAVEWLVKASDQGHFGSQAQLGRIYARYADIWGDHPDVPFLRYLASSGNDGLHFYKLATEYNLVDIQSWLAFINIRVAVENQNKTPPAC